MLVLCLKIQFKLLYLGIKVLCILSFLKRPTDPEVMGIKGALELLAVGDCITVISTLDVQAPRVRSSVKTAGIEAQKKTCCWARWLSG